MAVRSKVVLSIAHDSYERHGTWEWAQDEALEALGRCCGRQAAGVADAILEEIRSDWIVGFVQ